MKTIHLLILLLCLKSPCFEELQSNTIHNLPEVSYIHNTVSATNGLKLGILSFDSDSATNFINANMDMFLLFNLPNGGQTVYVPKDEYIGWISLYDANNKPVPKTALGESYKLKNDLRWNPDLVRQHGNGITAGWPASEQGNWSPHLQLPSPSQLFEIKKPGKYRLVLEFQVFLKTGTNKDLVHFPPLEIPVIQSIKQN